MKIKEHEREDREENLWRHLGHEAKGQGSNGLIHQLTIESIKQRNSK